MNSIHADFALPDTGFKPYVRPKGWYPPTLLQLAEHEASSGAFDLSRSRMDIQMARQLLLGQRLNEALAVLDRAERFLGGMSASATGESRKDAIEPQPSHRPPLAPDDDSVQKRYCLSGRERDVLTLVCGGLSNKRIAVSLAIAPETVKAHIKRIFVKLEVASRAQAVFRATHLGLLPHASGG